MAADTSIFSHPHPLALSNRKSTHLATQ